MTAETRSQSEIAKLLGITDRQVRNLTPLIFRPLGRKGNTTLYPLEESIQAYLAYKEEGGKREAPLSFEQARTRREIALAQLAELELSEKQGLVAKIEDVKVAVERAYGAVKSHMRAIPPKLAPRMVGLKDENQALALLESAIDAGLGELAAEAPPDAP